jgi:hypothetical protein
MIAQRRKPPWLMRRHPVSTRINHVANDDEACSAPVELAQMKSRIFL